MKINSKEGDHKTDIAVLIETASRAYQCRDLDALESSLIGVWPNFEADPDFSRFTSIQEAHLNMVSAYYLSKAGSNKNLKHYQARARKILTRAIDLFVELGDVEMASESRINMAFCYWYEGGIVECDQILRQTEQEFVGNHLNPVYLKIKNGLLQTKWWKGEYQEALDIIQEIEIPVEFCGNGYLQSIFNNEAGIVHRRLGKFDKAIDYYKKAIACANQVNNAILAASSKNNLAMVYNNIGNYAMAHQTEDEAIALAKSFNGTRWLANFLDTKSLIYFDENKYEQALQSISDAIDIFRQGEDAGGLTEALWNKVRCLLELGEKEEAILVFAELSKIAQDRIGEFGAKKFANEFAELFHAKRGLPLDDEIRRFKKMEVEAAVRKSDNNLTEAAEILKISESRLNRILLNEFPELMQELNAKMRLETGDAIAAKELAKAEVAKQAAHRDIRPLQLHDVAIFFENSPGFGLDADAHTYYVSADRMRRVFGYDDDAVIAVIPGVAPNPGDFILAESISGTDHYLSRVSYDKEIGYLLDEDKQLSLEETKITGKAIAYCPFENVADETLVFRPLPSQNSV